jgi:DNA polymerase III epsilon subunit-like protein
MKIISIDIETTGVDPLKNQLIQFAAVIDDTVITKPIEELPKFSCYVAHKDYAINSGLAAQEETYRTLSVIKKISDFQHSKELNLPVYNGTGAKNALGEIFTTPQNLGKMFAMWLEENHYPKNQYDKFVINSAGKNVAGFDIPFIKHTIPNWNHTFSFPVRVFDPAILFFDPVNDTELPNLSLCKERAGVDSYVSHDALDDAYDVINVLRKYWSKKWD